MSFEAQTWAIKDAPTANPHEFAVLAVLSEAADEDGCNACLSKPTIAERAKMDPRTVKEQLLAMEERGLIAEGDPRILSYLPKNRRPRNYDLMIPYAWFGSKVDRVNRFRAEAERRSDPWREPLTPQNRPPINPPPGKAKRSDVGKPNDKRSKAAKEAAARRAAEKKAADQGVPPREESHSPQRGEESHSPQAPRPGRNEKAAWEESDSRLGGMRKPPGRNTDSSNPSTNPNYNPSTNPSTTAEPPSEVASATSSVGSARVQAKHEHDPQSENEAQLTLGDDPDLPGAEVAVVDKTGPDAEARQLARDWLGYLDAQGTPPVKRKNGSPFWALAVPYRSAIEQGYTRDEIWAAMIAMYETRQTTVPTAELLSRALVQVRQRASVMATASPEILATADEILRQFAEFNGGVVLNGSRPRAVGQIVDALQNGATPERVALALQMCGEPAPPGWKFQRALFGKLPGASARQEDRDAVFVIGAAAAAAYDAAHGEASDLSANTTGGS